jgi:hypothetical protein
MVKAYRLFYKFEAVLFNFFDDLVLHFREFLITHCGLVKANEYFPNFLQGEMTKEALAKGYITVRGNAEAQTTRGVLYGLGIKPFVFYRLPKFFHEFPEDKEIIGVLFKQRVSQKQLELFFAFRFLIPIGFQINEESQYVESSMLSAHFGELMKRVAQKLKRSISELQEIPIQKIIRLLQL